MAMKLPAGVTGYTESEQIVWTPNTGDVRTFTARGMYTDVYNTFIARRAAAPGTADVFEVGFEASGGRATMYERRTRDQGNVTEEIFGMDVMKDILTMAYFDSLTNDQVVAVRSAYESMRAEGDTGGPPSGGFTGAQGVLYHHLAHGVETLPETAWIFASTERAVRYRNINASFADVNRVVTAPDIASSSIQKLVGGIPTGEWLYKPPRVISAGRGKYDVSREWWWAEKWSVVLGGTWGAPP